ncbi:hypothetical protein [uncultured Bartonella sp.]|nr:hypothetical protein [uncultured Bartonella sp.]
MKFYSARKMVISYMGNEFLPVGLRVLSGERVLRDKTSLTMAMGTNTYGT